MNDKDTVPNVSHSKIGRRWFAGAAAVSGLGLLGNAAAQGMTPPGGMGMHEGHAGLGGGMRGRPMDPETMAKHMERRISYLVWEIGGTPEQKDKLVAIAKAAMAELKPLHAQHLVARQKGMALLTAATIDKTALEQVRAEQIRAADATSQRMLKSLIEAAEVLNPEQRAKLAERIKQRRASADRGVK